MQQRMSVMKTAVLVMVLAVLLAPLSHLLEEKRATGIDQMQGHIGQMYVRYAAHTQQAPGVALEPLMELEDAWAIEDARQEAQTPLVYAMHNGSDELGYDVQSQTFYCTIGLQDEEWPELALTAKGAEGVRVAWIDDYAYDYRTDAVREGYRYELLAYTDTEFAYIGVVFTGLPIVTLHVEDTELLGDTYIAARASIAGGGYAAIDTAALVHLRGGGFDKGIDKPNYRVEFHRLSEKGKDKKNDLSVLGMEADSDWLLVGNAGDASCVRNALSFDLWNKWNQDGDAFALLESRMVEVFMQDEYMGLYQLMPRIRAEEELARRGDLNSDVVTRLIGMRFETGRPVSQSSLPIGGCLELRYAPEWMSTDSAFDKLKNYVTLNLTAEDEGYLDDASFEQLALECVDVEHIMSYYLYTNVCSLPYDNVKNNVYIWTRFQDGRYTYTLSPWDMDSGLKPIFTDGTDSINMWMTLPVRMLELNAGESREALWRIYREKREKLLSDDALYQWIYDMKDRINASGAYLRETERWRGGAQELNLAEISAHTIGQMSTIERHMQEIWPLEEME